MNTTKTFYAASIFFEIINQFGPRQLDLGQKQKYAVWKAADIRKAIKEGRKPITGPSNGDENLSIPFSTLSGAYDLGPSEPAVTSPRQDSNPSPQFHDKLGGKERKQFLFISIYFIIYLDFIYYLKNEKYKKV